MVMDFINAQSGSEDEEESEEEAKPAKRAAKKPAKKRKAGDSDSDGVSDGGSDDDYKPNKAKVRIFFSRAPARFIHIWNFFQGSKKKKAAAGSDDGDSDADWKRPKAKKSAGGAKKAGGGGGGKGKGFTRPLQLSPELASLMGCDTLPRHEVVKKVWALIKERNLYDPKNKQFAICDADLQKVIGVKRFRTFGMMKYLQPHFITN